MNYYLLEQVDKPDTRSSAIGKARKDVYEICRRQGYDEIEFSADFIPHDGDGLFKKMNQHWKVYKSLKKVLQKLRAGDRLLIQYPLMYNSIFWGRLLKRSKRHKIKVVCLIHDLDQLRLGQWETISFRKRLKIRIQETRQLTQCHCIIVHNGRMKDYLVQKQFKEDKIICLNMFDYLMDKAAEKRRHGEGICVAGNLNPHKAGYVYELAKIPLKFFLYGSGYDEKRMADVKKAELNEIVYNGLYGPEELPEQLEGNYGLVWDGDERNTCSGNFGNYERYNNPHKLSLYLAAGLPVIVWSQAAVSLFVKEQGVGIVVDSLNELPKRLSGISGEEYDQMKERVMAVGKKIRKGDFMKAALEKVHEL